MALMHGAKPRILKSDALGRVSTSREQREVLLDEFERSGLKGTQFDRTAGVKYATCASWVQKRRHGRGDYEREGKPGALRLIEAVVAAEPAGPSKAEAAVEQALEVLLPGGARLLVANASQVALVAKLIKTLARTC